MVGTPTGWGAACTAVLVVALGPGAPAMAHEEPAHDEHGQVATETDHTEHEPAPAKSDHADHTQPEQAPAKSDHAEHAEPQPDGAADHTDHEAEPDTVSGDTRVRVLSGFGAANAAVLGGALVLRRRDRRTGKATNNRGGKRR